MSPKVNTFARLALWALPVWSGLLFFGTLTHQPDAQTDFAGFAAYVTTTQFLFSHLFASILGAAIGSIGAIGLALYLQDTRAAGRAITGMVGAVLGNTITTAIFGIAAFAQPAMGRMFLAGQTNAQNFYQQVYGGPLFATAVVGLLCFMIGGVFSGIAVAASGRLPSWAGWVYAIMVPLFALSNFVLPIAQSFTSALLFIAAAAIAWSAPRQ
jgi:hypothetical protein